MHVFLRRMLPAQNGFEKAALLVIEGLIIVFVGILIVCGVWLLDRKPPLENLTGRFVGWAEDDPRVAIVEWSAIRRRSCQGWNYRNIVSDQIVIPLYPWFIEEREVRDEEIGNPTTWRVEFEVPHDFRGGYGSYRVRHEYHCNPLQRVFWPIIVRSDDVHLGNMTSRIPTRRE